MYVHTHKHTKHKLIDNDTHVCTYVCIYVHMYVDSDMHVCLDIRTVDLSYLHLKHQKRFNFERFHSKKCHTCGLGKCKNEQHSTEICIEPCLATSPCFSLACPVHSFISCPYWLQISHGRLVTGLNSSLKMEKWGSCVARPSIIRSATDTDTHSTHSWMATCVSECTTGSKVSIIERFHCTLMYLRMYVCMLHTHSTHTHALAPDMRMCVLTISSIQTMVCVRVMVRGSYRKQNIQRHVTNM